MRYATCIKDRPYVCDVVCPGRMWGPELSCWDGRRRSSAGPYQAELCPSTESVPGGTWPDLTSRVSLQVNGRPGSLAPAASAPYQEDESAAATAVRSGGHGQLGRRPPQQRWRYRPKHPSRVLRPRSQVCFNQLRNRPVFPDSVPPRRRLLVGLVPGTSSSELWSDRVYDA